MGEEEAAERELQSRRIHESRDTLSADTIWISSTIHGVRRDLPPYPRGGESKEQKAAPKGQ